MAAGLEVTTHQAGLGTPQCAASTGATHRAGGARHIPDAQCRDAIHHARPALAREPPARRGDHGVSVGIRPVTYSGRAGARCRCWKSQGKEKATQRAAGAHEPWLNSLPDRGQRGI